MIEPRIPPAAAQSPPAGRYERRILPPASGVAFPLACGERLAILDSEGGQSGDLVAFAPDGSERLSTGRSFDYNGKVRLSTGDTLWSDRSSRMLAIVSDTVGRHDMLYAPCSDEMYRLEYRTTHYHPNCRDNLAAALREHGIEALALTETFNFFMNVEIAPDGRLAIAPPCSRPGDSIVFRAEMDCVVALSACPAASCNGGQPPRALTYQILAKESDPTA